MVIVNGKMTEWFVMERGLRQRYIRSPWLFDLFIKSVLREIKERVLERDLTLVKKEEGASYGRCNGF